MNLDYQKYRDYPEGSGGKKIYDEFTMPFEKYLNKYFSNPNLEKWNLWNVKFIEPAYDKNRLEEMAKNFGYVSIDKHDFNTQQDVYKELVFYDLLPDDIKKFIGFMAGAGFFKKYSISLKDWLNTKYWLNPYIKNDEMKSINEIINYSYGANYLKYFFLQMPFWNR